MDLSPSYRACTKAIFISKGSYGYRETRNALRVWRDQKCIPLVGAQTPLTFSYRQTTPSQGGRHRAESGNLCKFRWTYRHITVFAPRQYLYQKEAKGMEKPEMYSPSGCKNPTYLCEPSNYAVSREATYGREWKLA